MRIAFYAPLKAPDSDVPSGDRQIARLLVRALQMGGHEVTLLSRFRAFEGSGNASRMRRLERIGGKLATRHARRLKAMPPELRPEAVFTYHVYDKAPDWIGPGVARALGIPYLICEASLNPKRAEGARAIGFAAARAAVASAHCILEINPRDRGAVDAALGPRGVIRSLAPFLDIAALDPEPGSGTPAPIPADALRETLGRRHGLDPSQPWLLAVAMMRRGDKLESYRALAAALTELVQRPWQLLVVGEGDARGAVEAAFRPLGRERIRFLGLQEGAALADIYRSADIFAWPAVNEALGMAILEAQALGCPVVAGGGGAVGAIVEHEATGFLVPNGDPRAFAKAVDGLLRDPDRAAAMGAAARRRARRCHGIETGAMTIDQALADSLRRVPARNDCAASAAGLPAGAGEAGGAPYQRE
ncbi:MAG: glycosyltransferase family 4 protein, partial [Alphaproteobacteria bacterium]|nr:glycosyltransferase family 4 protein [Alphaproteobacteria bacterium]